MKLNGSTVLVTGANRGLGRALVNALRKTGCAKVYAAARRTESLVSDGMIEAIQLDITNTEHVTSAAARCGDVDILINNAGVAGFTPALGAPTMSNARLEMETNYFGTLAMCRAFAPVLKRNGGGALVNVLSVVSWFNAPMQGTYCVSKAAESSLTKAVRFELRAQGTLVVGVYAGYIDTDMGAGIWGAEEFSKSSPAEIAACVLAGIEDGTEEILTDERARGVHSALLKDARPFEFELQKAWNIYAGQRR
ncbi:MAG TPA: SDR family oxidoreductase [bacterium]|nr:SDR family oxidoreductase [bacterium]